MIKKICFFANFYDFPKQKALSYYEKIFPTDINLFLLCPNKYKNKFKTENMNVHGFDGNLLTTPFKLRKFCQEKKIDVLTNLGGTYKMALVFFLATLFTKTKNLFYIRSDLFSKKRNGLFFTISKTIDDLFQSSFFFFQFFISRLLVVNKVTSNRLKKYLFFNENKICYLSLTIDKNLFHKKDKFLCRKKLNFSKNEKLIIYVGRIHYRKGSDFLLQLIKQNSDKKFILIGKILDESFKKENLANLVLIPSKTEKELVDYYNAADLCIFLSRAEGLGRVPREAMLCGIPTIVSDIETLEILKPAFKVPFNIKKIQEKIDYVLNLSEKEKKEIATKSRNFIIKEHGENVWKKKHLKYFLNWK